MQLVFYLGLILLLGLTAEKIIYRCKLPAVTGYLILGMLIGPSLLNILNTSTVANLAPINTIALGLIAFLIGGELSLANLRRSDERRAGKARTTSTSASSSTSNYTLARHG